MNDREADNISRRALLVIASSAGGAALIGCATSAPVRRTPSTLNVDDRKQAWEQLQAETESMRNQFRENSSNQQELILAMASASMKLDLGNAPLVATGRKVFQRDEAEHANWLRQRTAS